MGDEPIVIRNYLDAEDTTSTLNAMRALGALVEERPDELVIRGSGMREAREPEGVLDVGNAGTLMRLLPGWLAAQEGRAFTLPGGASMPGGPGAPPAAQPPVPPGGGAAAPRGRWSAWARASRRARGASRRSPSTAP